MRHHLHLVTMLAILSMAAPSRAHKPSDSYLTLTSAAEQVTGYWDVALRDLDRALTLDENGDGSLRWAELRARESDVLAHLAAHLVLHRGAEPCTLTLAPLAIVAHSDGAYARVPLAAQCSGAGTLRLSYGLFFAEDAHHRGIVRVGAEDAGTPYVVSAGRRALTLGERAAPPSVTALLTSGVEHIVTGFDHVLFLLALISPLVLGARRAPTGDEPSLAQLSRDVVKVVTAFTLAHSLTLGLAALGIVRASAAVIEPAIAASVALAAIENVYPLFGGRRFGIAFALGLLHGFGFASVLSDLGLSGSGLVRALVGFNLGVELGQVALVAACLPLGLLLRRLSMQRLLVLRGGSLAILAVSIAWFVERVRGG